jgi:hypothetical protein
LKKQVAKIKLKKLARFSDPKNCPSTHHDSPAIHHTFTTKTPREKRTFLQNHCKNAPPPRNKNNLKKTKTA